MRRGVALLRRRSSDARYARRIALFFGGAPTHADLLADIAEGHYFASTGP